jgi:rhamnosyltransferase
LTDAINDAGPIVPAATVLYRPDATLLEALLAPLRLRQRRLFIFVNGALDAASERILATLPSVRIIRSGENIGLGAGLNAVVGAASEEGYDQILLFDQDSTPSDALAERLAARFRALDGAPLRLAALGPKLLPPAGSGYLPIRYWRRPSGVPALRGAVDFLPTSGSLVSIAAWRQAGPFRADYFIGGIDVEWGYRCWASGFASILAEDIVMDHRWGVEGAAERRGGPQILRSDDTRLYYYIRNGVDGLRLPHMPVRWKARQTAAFVAQLSLLMARRGFAARPVRLILRAIRDGWTGRMGQAPADLLARQ